MIRDASTFAAHDPDFTQEYLLADVILGAVDIASWQQRMNTLKQVPVSVARTLLSNGQSAITHAQQVAKTPWYEPNLPGGGARANVVTQLQRHAFALASYGDPNAIYPDGDDLKKWVLAAFVESNAAEEGSAWVEQAWEAMWQQIARDLAALPAVVAKKVAEGAASVLGVPTWLAVVGGLGVVGLGVYVYARAKR